MSGEHHSTDDEHRTGTNGETDPNKTGESDPKVNWEEKFKEQEASMSALKKTNERILLESDGHKKKSDAVERERQEKERKLLEEKGSFQELYQDSQVKYTTLESRLDVLGKSVIDKNIDIAIRDFAPNVKHGDLVKKILLDHDVQVNKETYDVLGVEKAIEEIKVKYPDLFTGKVAGQYSKKVTSHGDDDETGSKDDKYWVEKVEHINSLPAASAERKKLWVEYQNERYGGLVE